MDRNADRFLRRKEVEAMVGLKTSSLYRYMACERFPAPLQLGPKLVAWRESDIRAWMASRPASRAGRTWQPPFPPAEDAA